MTETIDKLTTEKKVKATDAVQALADKHGGTITPELILEDAKRKRSPLHAFFCWDDTAAAREYRRIQAATLIRRIKVTYHASEERVVRVRAFVNVTEPDDAPAPENIEGHGVNAQHRGIYVSFETAMRFDNYRDQLLRQCRRDVATFHTKYAAIREAADIISAMEKFNAETNNQA